MKKTVKLWAWVWTDGTKQPIISVDETRELVAEEKRKILKGTCDAHGRLNRSLYRKTKVVPVQVTFDL